MRSSSRPVSRIPNDDRPLLTDGCPRGGSRPPVVPRYMVRVRRTYLARRPESRLPSASGTHSMQEAGTRSPYTTQYGGSGAFLSAQHAAAVRALARRGEACMRRGRELPRRPAVGRRVHAPPRAPAVHVHPQCCGREAAPNETVSLRARSCQHGATGMFGATIVGQVASAFGTEF